LPALLSSLALTASAAAQNSPLTLKPERQLSAVRDAGIYHVSTGMWTRTSGATAPFGPDTIYSNTAPSGYFSSAGGAGGFAPGSTNFDQGNVPSSMNTNHPGNRDEYEVNCVRIGYCDSGAAGTSGWEIAFYSSYAPCAGAATPDATINAVGLPAAGGCWTFALDLTGGEEVCLAADGGDGFDDVLDLDSFGWSFRYAGTGGGPAGFLLSGDPQSTDPSWVPGAGPTDGTNTYFGPASLCGPDQASGRLSADQWYLEDPVTAANSGCYFFGGYRNNFSCGGPPAGPYSSWFLELEANQDPCLSCVTSCFCLSNPNSTGVNSTMTVTGSLSVTDNDVTLTAIVPPNVFGFFITSPNQGFTPNPGGSAGNICLGAGVGRFQQLAMNSGSLGTFSISTTAGQWSLASIPSAPAPYAATAGGTANFQAWHRDPSPSGPTSNFTDGVTVLWPP